jgi:hypothetical protein
VTGPNYPARRRTNQPDCQGATSASPTPSPPRNTEADGTNADDKDYNIIWFTEACLSNALRLETYIQDAEREGDSGHARRAEQPGWPPRRLQLLQDRAQKGMAVRACFGFWPT